MIKKMKKYSGYCKGLKRGGAYYTVEATFIVTIGIVVLVAILYAGFYVHDRLELESITQEKTAAWVRMPEENRWSDGKFKKKLKKELKDHLYLLRVAGVSVSGKVMSKKVSVSFSLPISISFLKRVWGGDKGMRTEKVSVPLVSPLKWKWDADLVSSK